MSERGAGSMPRLSRRSCKRVASALLPFAWYRLQHSRYEKRVLLLTAGSFYGPTSAPSLGSPIRKQSRTPGEEECPGLYRQHTKLSQISHVAASTPWGIRRLYLSSHCRDMQPEHKGFYQIRLSTMEVPLALRHTSAKETPTSQLRQHLLFTIGFNMATLGCKCAGTLVAVLHSPHSGSMTLMVSSCAVSDHLPTIDVKPPSGLRRRFLRELPAWSTNAY